MTSWRYLRLLGRSALLASAVLVALAPLVVLAVVVCDWLGVIEVTVIAR